MSNLNEWAEYFDLEKTVKALELFGIKQPELITVQRFQMQMFAARIEPVLVPEDACEYCENMGMSLDCSNLTRLKREYVKTQGVFSAMGLETPEIPAAPSGSAE